MNLKDFFLHKKITDAMSEKINGNMKYVTAREVILWLLLTCFCGVLSYTAYQLWWPITPVRIDKIEVSKIVVNRGEDMYYVFEGEKFKPIPVHAILEMTNGERITLMNYTADNPVGTLWKKRWFVIPYHVIPGQYRLKWTGVYQINALRTLTYTKESDWITVR